MTIASRRITDLEAVSGTRYIYESPDGGKTVYQREAGSTEKMLIRTVSENNEGIRAIRLMAILQLSETDITLRDALEQLEALYILKYGDDKNN
jgi:hypothetical protein